MLRLCSSVLLLTESEQTEKRIFSVSSAEDLDLKTASLFESVKNIDKFEVILAEVSFLRFLKDRRESVIVIQPGEFLKKLITAGYHRFLFDIENKLEVLSCMYVVSQDGPPLIKIGDLTCDFYNHVYTYKGSVIFVTKSEERFLIRKLTETKGEILTSADRASLCRMRRRLGKEFLSDIRKERVVYVR